MNDESKKGELIEKENGDISLAELIPLAASFFESTQAQTQAQAELAKEQLKLDDKRIDAEKSAFGHKFWLLVFISVSIVAIASGLIFGKNDTVSGLAILSHVGAVVFGIIAGSGWERLRE